MCWQCSSISYSLHPQSVAFALLSNRFSQFFPEGADFITNDVLVDIRLETYIAFSHVYENCMSKLDEQTKLQVIWVSSDCPILWTLFVFLIDRIAFL